MDDFFKIISKAVMVFPVIVVILALIIKFNQPRQQLPSQNISKITPTVIVSPSPSAKPAIDLIGPWICQYKNQGQEYELIINNKKITLNTVSKGIKKSQDLSSYSGIFENLLKLDLGQLETMSKSYLPKGVDLKTLINSCKKN